MRYRIELPAEAEQFYQLVAQQAGRSMEQVLEDALYQYAGELSERAIREKQMGWRDGTYPN